MDNTGNIVARHAGAEAVGTDERARRWYDEAIHVQDRLFRRARRRSLAQEAVVGSDPVVAGDAVAPECSRVPAACRPAGRRGPGRCCVLGAGGKQPRLRLADQGNQVEEAMWRWQCSVA